MSDQNNDLSANTLQFQAFAASQDAEAPAAWEMKAPGSKIGLLAGIVIAVAVLAAIMGWVLIG